ncbi:MAG: AraC family transcriptional regulator [Calditrichaeota bacterium]|nr:AraC family transcriptional regulator [Calditrichota bacterium]
MIFELKAIPLLIGSFQALFFGTYLLLNSRRIISQLFFAIILLSYSLHLVGYAIIITPENQSSWFYFCVATYPFLFLIGPAHYLYVRSLSETDFKFSKTDLKHLIAVVLVAMIMYQVFFGVYYSKFITLLIASVFDWFTITYITVSLIKLRRYIRSYKDYESHSGFSHIINFYRFSSTYLVILLGYAINTILIISFRRAYTDLDYFFSIAFSIVLLCMSIEVLHTEKRRKRTYKTETPAIASIDPDELDLHLDLLSRKMKDDQLFLDENLCLADIARELSLPNYLITQLLNDKIGMSFYEYVNQFRVEKAKGLLLANNDKVLKIAYESGFSNKTSFNRTFRRFVHMTPSAFRQKNGHN